MLHIPVSPAAITAAMVKLPLLHWRIVSAPALATGISFTRISFVAVTTHIPLVTVAEYVLVPGIAGVCCITVVISLVGVQSTSYKARVSGMVRVTSSPRQMLAGPLMLSNTGFSSTITTA
jgi:hypothetical protein